jgi:hypothetical protein
MSVVAAEPLYSPEDLPTLPDGGKGYELVDGVLVEKHMETDELRAPDLIPELRVRVADLFSLPRSR